MKAAIITILLCLLTICFHNSYAQVFTPSASDNAIIRISSGGVDWGDYDNDGDLDLILIGNNYSRIYTNNLGGQYSNDWNSGIVGYLDADVAWGDYDNDGDLDYTSIGDILSCNYPFVVENITADLESHSVHSFVVSPSQLQGGQYGSLDWGDYDNDGDYDLAILGASANFSERYCLIYENVNGLMQLHASLTGLGTGVIKWADIDNDQDLDLFTTGQTTSSSSPNSTSAYVYLNNSGVFTNSSNSITPVNFGDADFGDYDNDGDLDLIVVGNGSSAFHQPKAQLYNNVSGIFTPVVTNIVPVGNSSAKWGDYDNDGDLDILIAGDSSHTYVAGYLTNVYRNDGGNVFVPISQTIIGCTWANARWADHDNDGDLDFILTGYSASSPNYMGDIYENQSNNPNTIPVAPILLSDSVVDDEVFLNWNQGSDNETPTSGLSYNIRVGNSPGGIEVVSPQSDLSTGYRRKVTIGNVQQNTAWKLKNLYPGDYFWSVQSIDGAFAGSAFSSERKFTVKDPDAPTLQYPYNELSDVVINTPLKWYSFDEAISYRIQISTTVDFDSTILDETLTDTITTTLLDIETTYYWRVKAITGNEATSWSVVYQFSTLPHFSSGSDIFAGVGSAQASFGDFDSDNDLDIVIAGKNELNTGITKIYENINNAFVDYNANLYQGNQGVCSWADFDNDNDLDLLSNIYQLGQTGIYENNAGVFDNSGLGIYNNDSRKVAWVDIDNDGDLDYALLGVDIYRNDNNTFVPLNAGLANTTSGDLEWGDYDNDLDMDLIVSGADNNSGFSTRIYRNSGGVFSEVTNHGLPGQTHYARARWGDVDQDGDLDVLLVGQTANIPYTWSVYLNNNGSFSLLQVVGDGISYGDIRWGDLDNDGDLDIVVAGSDKTYIYTNNNLVFTKTSTLLGGSRTSLDLGDYDNDGDLDILFTGNIESYAITRLFKNNIFTANTIPNPPTILTGSATNGNVSLSWNQGSDNETQATGLTYNYYFGTAPNSVSVSSPMAIINNGKRTVVSMGNANSNLQWNLKNILPGTYYWGVQSIDNNYDGSSFSSQQELVVPCTSVTTQNVTACDSYTWIDGVTYTNSDSATWILTNVYGCDSIIHLNITINNSISVIDSIISCGPVTWIDGNTYYQNTNTPMWTLQTSKGCDSIVHLDATILNVTVVDHQVSCGPFTWIDGNTYNYNVNNAAWIFDGSNGCDSIVILDLIVNHVDTTVEIIDHLLLKATATQAQFQWLDCEDNFAPITGENDSLFVVKNNGSYAVQITQNGCVDTSACVSINDLGLSVNSLTNNITAYPNPTKGQVTVDLGKQFSEIKVSLFDVNGRRLKEEVFYNDNKLELEIDGSNVIYILRLICDDVQTMIKIVKD